MFYINKTCVFKIVNKKIIVMSSNGIIHRITMEHCRSW